MKAVFSLCTKYSNKGSWFGFTDRESFACSAVLSVLNAKKFVGRVELYSDTRGIELLRGIGLEFDAVHNVFDSFQYPHHLWMTSKLVTYSMQQEPFVHIDLDAYLWSPLPEHLNDARFIAQDSEEDRDYYYNVLHYFFEHASYIPAFIRDHHATHGYKVRALNAGIYGGNDLAAIHATVDAAFATIHHPDNATMFEDLAQNHQQGNGLFYDFNVLLEQYYAAVYCFQKDVKVDYVLETDQQYFTHLLSVTKRNTTNVANLKARVRHDYPEYYALISSLVI